VKRVLLDTNIWVSAFLAPGGHCGKLVRRLLAEGGVEIVVSSPLLAELADVLARPRLTQRYKFGADEVKEYIGWIWSTAEYVEPAPGPTDAATPTTTWSVERRLRERPNTSSLETMT
jgi:putative PIN family toxin of toxin-antitoxin system